MTRVAPLNPGLSRWLLAVPAAAAIFGLAWWMTGPAPPPAVKRGTAQPPLLLTGVEADDPAIRAAARALKDGDVSKARASFTKLVAERPDRTAAEIGLVLTRWSTVGSTSVVRDLEQLQAEHPGEAVVTVHLGLGHVMSGMDSGATQFRQARSEARREKAYELAQRADDFLHPDQAPGYPPVLVGPEDVPPSARQRLRALQAAVERADRVRARALAEEIAPLEGLLAVAAKAASYDKDHPSRQLDSLADVRGATRPAAELHRGLVLLWGGRRAEGMRVLRVAETLGGKWGAQAAAIRRRLAAEAG